MLYCRVKKYQLIDQALHLYRSGLKVTSIAKKLGVDRRTIHRWVNESGASRDDYLKEQEAREKAIREEAEKKHTMMEQINHYRQKMLWEILTRYLPSLEVRTVSDLYKMTKTLQHLKKFENTQPNHHFDIDILGSRWS